MSVVEIKEHLKTFNTKFLIKQRALKLMNGLYIEVENETKEKWREIFRIKDAGEQATVEIVDVTEKDLDVAKQDPANTIKIDEDIMDNEEPK